ncbi:protein trichome birefringence-like [Diospyros lotus]|uniref:protein trichome birefringence-like n=1 Tax=Diospyros lotus TaxID=55363 RepID=UPI00224EC6F6|nr:protein trichome birefringence-like [Diospyros lotus]
MHRTQSATQLADMGKQAAAGGAGGGRLISEIKTVFSLLRSRKTTAFAYAFVLAFIAFTVFLAFAPSPNSSSPWFINIFTTSSTTNSTSSSPSPVFSDEAYRSHFSSIFAYFFPNSSQQVRSSAPPPSPINAAGSRNGAVRQSNQTQSGDIRPKDGVFKANQSNSAVQQSAASNQTRSEDFHANQSSSTVQQSAALNQTRSEDFHANQSNSTVQQSAALNQTRSEDFHANQSNSTVQQSAALNQTRSDDFHHEVGAFKANQSNSVPKPPPDGKNITGSAEKGISQNGVVSNLSSLLKKEKNGTTGGFPNLQKSKDLAESLMNCDLFDGEWVRDDSYPLYKPGSCSLIDEQFNCFLNGRPDNGYYKLKWKPRRCSLPRLNGNHMLELLRGKRLVFVGDSLNRNMWESLVCILRNSVKDHSKVYEAFGRHHFRNEASYSFVFEDYNCTVEFFVSPFLVQEFETPDRNGSTKETLRLDIIGRSASHYKNADFIIFNTGHWWTHEKTSKGEDYYQEGSHLYHELNVIEAFRRALTTWARWVDKNINPAKTLVFFRGYSASHFSGGQWNSGGQCDHETEPIKNETYLKEYPPKMMVLERVLKGMRTHVSYLNITRLTDYRKDGHPSMYRKQNLSQQERRSPLMFQDCSHWCLPGVPDSWNEILYAELLRRQHQKVQQLKRP